jgi:hypothetical protein
MCEIMSGFFVLLGYVILSCQHYDILIILTFLYFQISYVVLPSFFLLIRFS